MHSGKTKKRRKRRLRFDEKRVQRLKLRRVEIQDPPRLDVKTPTETELRKASVEKENPMSRARPPGPQKTTSSAHSSRKNERNGKFGIHDQTDLVEFYRSIQ